MIPMAQLVSAMTMFVLSASRWAGYMLHTSVCLKLQAQHGPSPLIKAPTSKWAVYAILNEQKYIVLLWQELRRQVCKLPCGTSLWHWQTWRAGIKKDSRASSCWTICWGLGMQLQRSTLGSGASALKNFQTWHRARLRRRGQKCTSSNAETHAMHSLV